MERDIKSCIECYEETESGSPAGKSKANLKHIINDFNELYKEQLKIAQDASEGTLQLQIKTLQHWVFDLSEQNKMLVKTVEELEGDAMKNMENAHSAHVKVKAAKRTINNLHNDLYNLVELLRRLRLQGVWNLDGLMFKELSYEDIFGQPPPPRLCCQLPKCPLQDLISNSDHRKFNNAIAPENTTGYCPCCCPCTCSCSN